MSASPSTHIDVRDLIVLLRVTEHTVCGGKIEWKELLETVIPAHQNLLHYVQGHMSRMQQQQQVPPTRLS